MTRLFKRGKFWWVDYAEGGRRKRRSLGLTTRKAAETARAKLEMDLAQGRGAEVIKLKLDRVIVHYLRYCEVRNSPATIYNKKIYCRRYLAHFGAVPITSIARNDVEAYLRQRKAGPPTINRELATLRHLFNFAVEWGKLEKNPANGVKFLPEKRKPLNLPPPEEIKTWLSWCRDNDTLLYNLSIIALNTGLRRGDILNIRGENVDLRRRILAVPVAKTGAVQYVPLNDQALNVLAAVKKPGRVFEVNSFKRRFKKALAETGLKFRFHDFRHVFATAVLGISDSRTAQGLLGHAKISTTERYLALLDDRQRKAVESLKWHI